MDGGTKHIRRECIVDGNPDKVHETFLSQVWWHGGFPFWVSMCLKTYQIEPSKDNNDTGLGGIRQVPTYLQEEIVGAEKGKFVEYRVRRKAWLPINYHHGRVSFESSVVDTIESKTKVVWEITYTPKWCFGGFLYFLFVIMIGGFFLPRLKTSCKSK